MPEVKDIKTIGNELAERIGVRPWMLWVGLGIILYTYYRLRVKR